MGGFSSCELGRDGEGNFGHFSPVEIDGEFFDDIRCFVRFVRFRFHFYSPFRFHFRFRFGIRLRAISLR